MKKALSFVAALFLITSSIGLVSCSDNSSTGNDRIEGTTTGGLDIGIASDAASADTAATDTDTLGTTTE